MDVYLETGAKRVFAGALDWPGWCRSARDAGGAVAALLEYAPRYGSAVARARQGFEPPSGVKIVQRLKGDATTDFGAPGAAPKADRAPLDDAELKRLTLLLRACWDTFDAAATKHAKASLRKGPRGGGREVDQIVAHVHEAETAYVTKLGARAPKDPDALRRVFADALASRARGEPIAEPSRTKKLWLPRFAVRRSAWHALDHAWEIEDRAA